MDPHALAENRLPLQRPASEETEDANCNSDQARWVISHHAALPFARSPAFLRTQAPVSLWV